MASATSSDAIVHYIVVGVKRKMSYGQIFFERFEAQRAADQELLKVAREGSDLKGGVK